MRARAYGLIGAGLLAAVATASPAFGFSDGSDSAAATDAARSGAAQQSSSSANAYSFSGPGFNFTINREPQGRDDAAARLDNDDKPSIVRPHRGFFARMYHDFFDDNDGD